MRYFLSPACRFFIWTFCAFVMAYEGFRHFANDTPGWPLSGIVFIMDVAFMLQALHEWRRQDNQPANT